MTPADIARIRALGRDKCPPDLQAEYDAAEAEALAKLRDEVMTLDHLCGVWVIAEDYLALRAKLAVVVNERARLALAICGGEDAPGYANAQTVETLERLARQNASHHMSDIDRLMDARAALAEAEKALAEAVDSIDAAYDGPDDEGRYSKRQRIALASIREALK